MNAYKGVIPTTVWFNDSFSNQDYTELTTGQQQADIILTTVEFNDSLSNLQYFTELTTGQQQADIIPTTVEFNDSLGNLQDYTELTTGQQQADITAGKDVDDSEYNYGTILVRKGYIGSLKNLAGSCIISCHWVNK